MSLRAIHLMDRLQHVRATCRYRKYHENHLPVNSNGNPNGTQEVDFTSVLVLSLFLGLSQMQRIENMK
jgi:hypothetical protein